jgi:hypothetical protein
MFLDVAAWTPVVASTPAIARFTALISISESSMACDGPPSTQGLDVIVGTRFPLPVVDVCPSIRCSPASVHPRILGLV